MQLRIPGPTPLPPDVVASQTKQMINHRGPEFGELIAHVRGSGTPVPDGEIVTSDHVLPAEDTTLEEAREAFSGEGAIPG